MNGFLLVDKPTGWTSFDVVAKVRSTLRRSLGKVKVGHAGTLDPAATGLLLILIGSYTKLSGRFSKLDKTYQAEVTLGMTSTTGDGQGELQPVSPVQPNKSGAASAVEFFVGEIQQTPPAYSAIKVAGQRAYKLARLGQVVNLEPRQVTIYSIEQLQYSYPKLDFICEVSSGTYIRSLAADIGSHLQTGAYLSALRRLEIGNWSVDQALQIQDINADMIGHRLQTIDQDG